MNYQVIAPPPSLKRFVCYFWTLESQTDDVSQKAFTIMPNGERSKLNTGDFGFIALIEDTEGNLIGLHSLN